jgi:hypothetical protein
MPPITATTEVDLPTIWQRADRYSWAFAATSGALIVAGGLVAAINSATPFAHGSWVAAYLVLVGGVAQMFLGVWCLGLPEPKLAARLRGAELGLWNVGNAIVVGGVLTESASVVVVGSAMLLGALAGFALGGGPIRRDQPGRVIIYRIVILGLAGSVVIGAVLAHSSPGG